MIKWRSVVSLVVLTLNLIIWPITSLAQNFQLASASSQSSYELFWPVVAGRVMGDSLYALKTLKEELRGIFILDDVKRGEYAITLSEKRIVEAEYLYTTKRDFANGEKTLDVAQQRREEAYKYLTKAKGEGNDVSTLRGTLVSSLTKQYSVLKLLATTIPADQMKAVKENIAKLNSILLKLQ